MGPRLPRPSPLTQHGHGVQPGVFPGRVVGHAGVGARVRGLQALQHQGAAVQVEPAVGRLSREQVLRLAGPPPGAGAGGAGRALPEVGARALAQRAAVLQPGHFGRWLPISFTVQVDLLPLQDAVLLRGTRAPDPGGHCGRGCGEARAGAGAGLARGWDTGRVQGETYPARPPRSPCGPRPGRSRPRTCRCQPGPAAGDSAGGGPPGRPHRVPRCSLWDRAARRAVTCTDLPP